MRAFSNHLLTRVFVAFNPSVSSGSLKETMDLERNCAACIDRLLGRLCTENADENDCFNKEGDLIEWERRKTAIQRGLSFIYEVSKNVVVFNTFGNDIIQCFYDISRVGFFPSIHDRYLPSPFAGFR